MVAIDRHDKIIQVDFSGQKSGGLPVEVVDRSDLMNWLRHDHPGLPERNSFFVMMLARDGVGSHLIDFQTIPVQPGRLILIQPDQVQLWDVDASFEASVVLARPEVALARRWFPGDVAYRDLGPDALESANSLIDTIRREQCRSSGGKPSARFLSALFVALLALFDHGCSESGDDPLPEPYLAFRAAVEANVGMSRSVRDYVADLGFSERTVTRACQRVTGRSAKALLDDRLILEAKRLLAHTNEPAAAIAAQLGFSESTNFSKFFARHVGQLLSAFRHEIRPVSKARQTLTRTGCPLCTKC